MAIINISVGSFLPITQGTPATPGIIPQQVTSTLAIAQAVDCSFKNESTNQPFNVQQAVAVGKILNIDVANILTLTQVMGQTYAIDLGHFLTISQVAANVNPQEVIQGLAITQSVIPSRALGNTLVVAQAVTFTGTYSETLVSSLGVSQQVTFFKTDAVDIYNITVPLLIDPIPIVLSYGSTSVVLKIPELGDSDKIDVRRVQEQTRGGDLIIFRDPIWSITETLKFKFVNLTRNRSQDLLAFFRDTIGLSVQLTDHQGVLWNGIITTPEADVICINDNNCGSYEVEFEFQGEQA